MENAVIRGSIREESIIHDKPDYDAYVAEFVVSRKVLKPKIPLPKRKTKERIDTKEIILKHCIFCWKQLIDMRER